MLLVVVFWGIGCSHDDGDSLVGSTDGASEEDVDMAVDGFAATLADPEEGLLPLWGEAINPPMQSSDTGKPGVTQDYAVLDTLIRERGGLTMTMIHLFYDAEGNEYQHPDSLTVRMTRDLTIEGTVEGPRRSVIIDHTGFLEVEGLARGDTIRTLNDEGRRHVEGTFQANWRDLSREWNVDHAWTATDMQFHIDRFHYPFPLQGVVTVTSEVHRSTSGPNGDRSEDFEIEYTVTFDGTRYALVELSDGRTFYIDLTRGRAHRHRP